LWHKSNKDSKDVSFIERSFQQKGSNLESVDSTYFVKITRNDPDGARVLFIWSSWIFSSKIVKSKVCIIFQYLPISIAHMQAELRQKLIEQYLEEVEFASLEELSDKVDASLSTVRRDLGILSNNGKIKRTHGGARLIQPPSEEFNFSRRQTVESDGKLRVAERCAELVSPNQNIFLDAGSTVFEVARKLEEKTPHIVTNSLSIANLYAGHRDIEVIVSGGVIYPRLQVLVGELAVKAYQSFNADIAILGAGGATEDGIMNSHMLLIEIQRAMIASAQQVIVCLDSSKMGRRSFTPLCDWKSVDVLVTNRDAPKALISHIKKQKVEVLLA
jgi:DeoR/GlpR family transcriptional regulator of sugar metabolism